MWDLGRRKSFRQRQAEHSAHCAELLGESADPGYYGPADERSPMKSSLLWLKDLQESERPAADSGGNHYVSVRRGKLPAGSLRAA